ncbi:MAG: DUF4389 domain-containing protein [Cryobacterium sp.]
MHHTELRDRSFTPFRAEYRDVPGATAPAPPRDQPIWTQSASGPGQQQISWDIRSGDWAVVVMNSDASPRVAASIVAGVRSGLFGPLAIGLLAGGGFLLLLGVALVVVGVIGMGRSITPLGPRDAVGPGLAPVPGPGREAASEERPYPARLTGELDPQLSNWMWLVKWFLAIPHVVVLAFLWLAFVVATIVAWFAILFTAKYPASIFAFNVGVLRWNWRVAFYAYSALGTDRYPPFTLSSGDYPADVDVDYPERLSRGLVLVKSWLLAIPHLLIVAAFTGAAWAWRPRSNDFRSGVVSAGTDFGTGPGISLLGLLVLVAAVILLITGRYRRALFDLIMGLNRWAFRVVAHAALMRDEYPPFRLDQGGADPSDGAVPRP